MSFVRNLSWRSFPVIKYRFFSGRLLRDGTTARVVRLYEKTRRPRTPTGEMRPCKDLEQHTILRRATVLRATLQRTIVHRTVEGEMRERAQRAFTGPPLASAPGRGSPARRYRRTRTLPATSRHCWTDVRWREYLARPSSLSIPPRPTFVRLFNLVYSPARWCTVRPAYDAIVDDHPSAFAPSRGFPWGSNDRERTCCWWSPRIGASRPTGATAMKQDQKPRRQALFQIAKVWHFAALFFSPRLAYLRLFSSRFICRYGEQSPRVAVRFSPGITCIPLYLSRLSRSTCWF